MAVLALIVGVWLVLGAAVGIGVGIGIGHRDQQKPRAQRHRPQDWPSNGHQ